jgi:hypothetical protein
MTRNEALKAFYDTPWGAWARDQPGVFYTAETLHFIGLSLLLGALLLADLRLLGLWKNLKPAHVIHFVRFAAVGFVINLVTGVVMFCADPYNYWNNWMFQLKVILILAAGANLIFFQFVLHRRIAGLYEGADADALTKTSAALSLLLWTLIIIAGRLLPSYEGAGGWF